jgi:hypothetical protein
MDVFRSLASVAQFEFDALVQETKGVVNGLRRQRESVVQAIERAHAANERADDLPDEEALRLVELLVRLQRLNAALDQVTWEVEQIETASISAGAEPFIVVPLILTQLASEDSPLVETSPHP